MPLRKFVFWIHLTAGLVCGVVIFIMSFTGAALALQPQLLLWLERDARRVEAPAAGQDWLGPSALLERVRAQRADGAITGLVREHDPTQAVAVTIAGQPSGDRPAAQTTLWVNPYSGAILGELSPASPARRFFRIMTDWHRWLALNGDQRNAGRWITGVSNAAFLVLALTGLYIWVPVLWSSPAFRAVGLFRGGLRGKARDFNWHNVIGVWSAAVLVVLTFTAMCISFPKTYDVIYGVTGMTRPPGPAAPTGAAPRGGAQRAVPPPPAELDRVWALAEARMARWRSINMRLPQQDGQPVTFTMNDRDRFNAMARSTLTVNAATVAIVRWEPYDGLAAGQRLRTWMRFGHTGELWGVPGQVIAGLASAGGCVLVWTAVALALRRFSAWRARRARRSLTPLEADKAA